MKKHFGIQEEGDPDLFFDVAQERQQEQQDELFPAAIDSELSGEIMVAHQTYLPLCLVWLTLMTTMTQCQRMFQLQLQLPLSFPINGDMQGFVSASSRVLETFQQNLSSLLT